MNAVKGVEHVGWKPVAELPDGPLDLIGDVHGEVEAFESLLERLGYDSAGRHPRGRFLVLLGDLIDRGPDSLAVVRRVADFVTAGRAICVMGNHDFNAASGSLRRENTWLFGHGPVEGNERPVASQREREEVQGFLGSLPLAARRHDLRAVHACWNEHALAAAGAVGSDALSSYRSAKSMIDAKYKHDPKSPGAKLARQNDNPVKLVTSGLEEWREPMRFIAGKMRGEARVKWWEQYQGPMVVFGHYWRVVPPANTWQEHLFEGLEPHELLAGGNAMCIDYSVGSRAAERRSGNRQGPFVGRLAAMRWPERELLFDDGERRAIAPAMMEPEGV